MINYALSFVAIVKAASFTLAAKNLGVSKAQLSRHLKRLEEQLGIQLLFRTTRSLVLTEEGKQFYQACLGIEESYDEAIHSLQQDFKSIHGTLKITAPVDFGIEFLPPIIYEFTQKYSQINVNLVLSNVNEDLIQGNYDLAIRIANTLPDSSLRMTTLMQFRRLICVAPRYLKTMKAPKQLSELKNHTCITSLNHNSAVHRTQWQFIENKKIVSYPLGRLIEIDSLFAQLNLIHLGAGIGRMPNYLIDQQLKSKKLIELFSDIEKPLTSVYLVYPDKKALPKKTQLFIQFLKKLVTDK